MTATCPWWKRWWHRRKRWTDTRTLFVALTESARRKGSRYTPQQLIDHAKSMTGFEHWRCPCAKADLARREARGDGGLAALFASAEWLLR